jgi:formate/nitrite transporter FocA (FNT family)
MYSDLVNRVSKSAIAKVHTLRSSKTKYFISSILAGMYVGLGVFLIMTIGGVLRSPGNKDNNGGFLWCCIEPSDHGGFRVIYR